MCLERQPVWCACTPLQLLALVGSLILQIAEMWVAYTVALLFSYLSSSFFFSFSSNLFSSLPLHFISSKTPRYRLAWTTVVKTRRILSDYQTRHGPWAFQYAAERKWSWFARWMVWRQLKILFSLRMNNHPTPNRRHTQQFTPHTQTYTTSLNFMIPFINLKAYIHILHARLIVVFAGKAAFCFDCSDNNKVVTRLCLLI